MAPATAPLKPACRQPLAGGVSKKKKSVGFTSDVQEFVLDMQKAAEFQTPNRGDVVEARAHTYQVKLEMKQIDVEQLEAVIDECSREREELLLTHPTGSCCFGLTRQASVADRRAYDLEMRIMQAENELGKEREQLEDLEQRFKAQVELLVARVAASLAADIDEEEFFESPTTSETQGPALYPAGTPNELADIWEGDGDDSAPDDATRAPSVPLTETEEGARAEDIILSRLSMPHTPPPPAARTSNNSINSGSAGGAGPRISFNGGSAPLVKRASGQGLSGRLATGKQQQQQPQPFEAREGERWPAERPWEQELGDPERRHSGKKRVSGAQKLYARVSGGNSMRSTQGSDTGGGSGGPPSPSHFASLAASIAASGGAMSAPACSPNRAALARGLSNTGLSAGSMELLAKVAASGKSPGPPLRKLSLKDAVKALEVARDKANALDSTPLQEVPQDGTLEAKLQPLLAPRGLERHPSALKLRLPTPDAAEAAAEAAADAVGATAGHTPHPTRIPRLSFQVPSPFGGGDSGRGSAGSPPPPGRQRSFQVGALRPRGVGGGRSSTEAVAQETPKRVQSGPKPPLAKGSFGKMASLFRPGRGSSNTGGGAESPTAGGAGSGGGAA